MGLDCPQPFGAISWLQIQLQVQVHLACLWATGIDCRNLDKIGENVLQSARGS